MHYKDGTPAAIGDKVKGKPYNTIGEVVGEMVSITPGSDSCNCIVAFVEVFPLDKIPFGMPGMLIQGVDMIKRFAVLRQDYGQCSDFLKVV